MLHRRSWVGPALLLAVAVRTIGIFLRYETFRPGGANSKLISFSVYDGLGSSGRLAFFLSLALTAALGCALVVRPNRVCAALVGGFCIGAAAAAAYMILIATGHHPSVDFGTGFFVIFLGVALEGAVGAMMLLVVASASDVAEPANSRNIGLAALAAVLAGVSTCIRTLDFRASPLFKFAPLSFRSGAAAILAFAAAAIVPVLAVRVQGRAGSALLIGLSASFGVSVIDALSQRYGSAGEFFHITIGFWAEVLAMVLLLVLAASLAATRQAQPDETGGESEALAI